MEMVTLPIDTGLVEIVVGKPGDGDRGRGFHGAPLDFRPGVRVRLPRSRGRLLRSQPCEFIRRTRFRVELAQLHVLAGGLYADSTGVVSKRDLDHPPFRAVTGIAKEKGGRGDFGREDRAFEWIVDDDLGGRVRGDWMIAAGSSR